MARKTGKRATGASGGYFIGISRAMANYSMVELDNMRELEETQETRHWRGRFLRSRGRDTLMIAAYFPPGGDHGKEREGVYQDPGTILNSTKCPHIVVADWNCTIEELAKSGFLNFTNSTAIVPEESKCTQGEGSKIDYVIASGCIAGGIKVEVEPEVPWGPHLGLSIDFETQIMEDTEPGTPFLTCPPNSGRPASAGRGTGRRSCPVKRPVKGRT
jgi:hypothetical protein